MNTVEENIKVYLRLKPQENDTSVWTHDPGCIYQDLEQVFSFDTVFGPEASNKHIYQEVKTIVDSAVEGINGTVFMYG
jgi:hypothetical protein